MNKMLAVLTCTLSQPQGKSSVQGGDIPPAPFVSREETLLKLHNFATEGNQEMLDKKHKITTLQSSVMSYQLWDHKIEQK